MWSRALLANKSVEKEVSDRDRPILGYLQDIQLDLHEEDFGFTLTFEFEENQYFEGTVLTKKFEMSKPNVIEKCTGTEIKWK
jgi:nucleosome assembly protein 1-like 1